MSGHEISLNDLLELPAISSDEITDANISNVMVDVYNRHKPATATDVMNAYFRAHKLHPERSFYLNKLIGNLSTIGYYGISGEIVSKPRERFNKRQSKNIEKDHIDNHEETQNVTPDDAPVSVVQIATDVLNDVLNSQPASPEPASAIGPFDIRLIDVLHIMYIDWVTTDADDKVGRPLVVCHADNFMAILSENLLVSKVVSMRDNRVTIFSDATF